MLQGEADGVVGSAGATQGKFLANTQEGLEVDVGLHPKDDGRARGLNLLRPVSTDKDEWIVDGTGCGDDDDIPDEIERGHLDEDIVHPFSRLTTYIPVLIPRFP